MKFNFDEFKVQGIKFNYYYICMRKLWLFSNGIAMEENNDRVQQGKIIHENSYNRKEKNKEKLIDGLIKIDIFEKENIREIKLTSKMKSSDRMQLMYYLYYLKQMGIKKSGTLNYVNEKKVEKIILTKKDEEQIEEALEDIKKILTLKKPPKIEKLPYCKSCAYYEYCYIRED